MEDWVQMLITIAVTLTASSGFWAFMMKFSERRDSKTRLLIGMAHDRILYLGTQYLKKDSVTCDEYENLYNYLYVPYKELGGNGAAERIMEKVKKLSDKKED